MYNLNNYFGITYATIKDVQDNMGINIKIKVNKQSLKNHFALYIFSCLISCR